MAKPKGNLLWVGTRTSNLVAVYDPTTMGFGIQDVSSSESGRDQTGEMHKEKITQKYKISLTWVALSPAETAEILTQFDPEYFYVRYTDPKTNTMVTKKYYAGDRSTPILQWTANNKLYDNITFDIIEV